MSVNNDQLDTQTTLKLDRFYELVSARVEEIRREHVTSLNEMEFHLLEKIDAGKRENEALGKRVQKLEDSSAWNLLLEEAKRLDMTPEQLLKQALTEYTKKHKGLLKQE